MKLTEAEKHFLLPELLKIRDIKLRMFDLLINKNGKQAVKLIHDMKIVVNIIAKIKREKAPR
jgi:hypothetical protein